MRNPSYDALPRLDAPRLRRGGCLQSEDLIDNDPRFDAVSAAEYPIVEKMDAAEKISKTDMALYVVADTEFGLLVTAGYKWRRVGDDARALFGA